MLPFRHGTAWRALFLLCVLSYFINVASSEGRVVCYYTNWSVYRPGTAKFNPQNINPYLCTHLIYAFGGFTKDNQMKPFDKYQDIEQGGYAKFTGLKTYNKQLKTMIAIGGWNEASSRFSPLVANPERRQQFIKNILKFLRQNHFDGIDLDWEYPAHREGGKSRDRDNYAEFVRELRAEFERESEKTGRTRLLLTMAVPAGIEYIDKGYDVPKLNKYLDWFNVLTYDFHSSHEPSVNHHAPLYSLEDDSEYNYDAELNIDYSIKYYLKAGADRDKLVLGIPTYGRSYTLINEESTELGAPSEGPGEQGDATREKGYLAYYEICQTLKDDPDWTVVQPNENVMGPYAYRRNQWVGYDDEAIVRKKAEYVVAHGLGGIMFWAIDNDDFRGACSGKPYPLIEAAKEAMLEAFGLGINEVGKPSSPQKPSRSRGRDRNQLTSKPDSGASRQSATRRPAVSSTTTVTPRSTAAIRLTEAEGSSLYIGGRGSTTPAPPTTPDPGSDFKCEEEGFFQHPRDCKKYYWCLDSGPSGLGIVGHQFTCPSGLYFNPAADSCDFARNVPCKTKKSTTSPPITTTTAKTTTTTTRRPASNQNRVTAAPVARPIYPRVSSTTSTTTTTTSTTTTAAPEVIEYDEEDGNEEHSVNRFNDAEEDPQVIKELIDLIRKVGGVEKLEKHLLQNKDGSITLKEHSASVSGNGAPTTPSTISKSLYDRVLKRPGTFNAFTRNRVQVTETTESSKTLNNAGAESSGEGNSQSQSSYSKYSSVVRGNSRQGPQNEGIDKIAESEGFLKERKQYVTINRNRGVNREEHDTELTANNETDDEELDVPQPETTTRRPLSAATPSYTSLRRARPSTTTKPAPLESESEEEQEEERRTVVKEQQTQTKHYATLSRTRGRTTERSDIGESEGSGVSVSSTTNRYKYVERTRPTTSSSGSRNAVSDAIDDEADEDDEEEYEDDSQQKNVKFQRNQFTTSTTPATTNTRKYASIGRRTTTTTTTPETTTTTATGTETAKASTDTDTKNTNNNNRRNNNNVKTNNVPSAAQIITQEPETTATTTTITNETTEPIDKPNTRITLTTSATNIETTTATTTTTSPPTPTTTPTPTPTPTILPTIQTPTTSINSLDLADGINDLFEPQLTTLSPANVDDSFPNTNNNRLNNLAQVASTTTTESEQQATRTTTTTTTTDKSDSNKENENENDDKNNIDSEVTTTTTIKTPYKRIRTNINNQNNNRNINKINNDNINNNNAEAVNEASPNVGNSKGLSSVNPSVNSIRTNYSGRRQPQRTSQLELTTTTTTELPSISSPRPFGYPRRRTRPVATKTQTQTAQSTSTTTTTNNNTTNNSTVNVNENDNNENKTLTDVAKTRTRLSQVDRPKNHRSPASALSSTTSPPPPATTLLHVFTLLDGETNDGDDHEPTGRPATTSKNRHKITASVEPKHKLIEINRIVEINSKQARLAQRKSKANQEFSPGILRVESLPHVEQLGEISVVKYVHLVDGSDIQVNDGHSTVADYTPTESIIPKSVSSSAPVRNSLPETESSSVGDSDSERNGKSLLPEVIREAFETSTISLEGLFDSARKAKLLNINNNINGNSNSNSEDEEVKSSTIHQELEKEQEQQQQQDSTETAIPATYLRTPTATTTTTATATTTTTMTTATAALTSTATATVSRRPVLSVRRRIINTPVAKSEATTQPTDELLTTTSNKYIRRGSKQSTAAAASAATTTTTSATSTSNIHLSKLKTQSSSATIYSNNNNNNNNGSSVGNINVDSPQQQQKQHKFQAASFALRRQFQTRRLTTTASPANNDESSTEVPRTQNPLFKRRLTLTSTAQPPRTTTIAPEITTDFGIDNDGDQVAKSSIQSSQFNQIPEQVRPASISTTAPHFTVNNSTRRQLIARPRRPQSVTSTTTAAPEFAPPLSRRQQSRRRPHKYIEVYNRPPGKPALTTPLPAPTNPAAIRRSSAYNDYTDDSQPQLRKKSKKQQPQSSPKVVLHGRGIIECLDEGNFPHPNSCRKFISCAKFVETGGIVGWEYTCPKGLGYDSLSGMCTYVTTSDGKACRD
ncbi:mucin-2 isoform X5 [Drosophila sulfurigaster albostrigata]|uniref:mucin-2 isoform X5 n=1 Tax=Drosophila sulfurigaster albostrigata TaxID=89887 RepID=UPI002D21A8E1|nr:mucin-2 isoform X5 [Drosophila sulfurigaster albostrigata]